MRVVIVGLGIQGRKRMAIAAQAVVATVDPVIESATFKSIQEVPLDSYDAVFVCTPDQAKFSVLNYLLSHKKHVLVEKPLLADTGDKSLLELQRLAASNKTVCYTAYNHRFEPHILRTKRVLDEQTLGRIYLVKFFYGNGTAFDVKQSVWRDKGLGVLPDLGSHVLDLTLFLFGEVKGAFKSVDLRCFENRSLDYAHFICQGDLSLVYETTLLSWKNTFLMDIFGEKGSLHVNGLCKWGPSILNIRKRVLPSGKPMEESETIVSEDPTWKKEQEYFYELCLKGGSNLTNDIWIGQKLNEISRTTK